MWIWNLLQAIGTSPLVRVFGVALMNVGSFVCGLAFRRVITWNVHQRMLSGEGAHGKVLYKQVLLPEVRTRRLVLLADDAEVATHRVLTIICVEDPSAELLFGQETSLMKEWYRRAKKCTLADPIVSMDGMVGSLILDRFVKFISARHRQHERKSSIWILVPVHERHRLLRDRAPAVMLVQRDDLEALSSWRFCLALMVDESWNAAHVVTLHFIALEYARFREKYLRDRDAGVPDTFGEQFREVVLPLNTDWPNDGTDYYVPCWPDMTDLLTVHKLQAS